MLGLCWGQLASIILHPHREWSQRPPTAAGSRGLPPSSPHHPCLPARLHNKEQWGTGVKWKQLLKVKDGNPHWDSIESCDGGKTHMEQIIASLSEIQVKIRWGEGRFWLQYLSCLHGFKILMFTAQTGRWKHIFWIICNTELIWQLFTLSISLPLPIMHSNMAAHKKNNKYMWIHVKTKIFLSSSIKKGFIVIISSPMVIFNLQSCKYHNMTVINTFYHSHLRCPLPTKLAQPSTDWKHTYFSCLFFSFANFQQMCLTLGWKPC